MPRGSVKWFNATKGFGFIIPDEADAREVFVHYSGIEMEGFKCLYDNDQVEYTLTEGPKGPIASKVKLVGRTWNKE
jgi:CspA family cold shock protein